MAEVINMQDMRNLNLFGKVTKIRTRFSFKYNEAIIFCVPKEFIYKAVGENGKNVKELSNILGKKIKIIPIPNGIQDAKKFIEYIVNPVEFQDLEVKDNEMVLTAGNRNKASLFGRNKRRFLEMQKIIKIYFSKEFKIV